MHLLLQRLMMLQKTASKIVSTFLILPNGCLDIQFTPFLLKYTQFEGCLFVDSHFFHGKCIINLIQVRKFNFDKFSGWRYAV